MPEACGAHCERSGETHVHRYNYAVDLTTHIATRSLVRPQEQMTRQEAGSEVDRRVRAYMAAHEDKHYDHALRTVLRDLDSELRTAYAGLSTRGAMSPADQVHDMVLQFMRKTAEEDYVRALAAVLADNPTLKEAYAGVERDANVPRADGAAGAAQWGDRPDAEVDRRVSAMRAKQRGVTYEDAMRSVLNDDPELKRAYGHGYVHAAFVISGGAVTIGPGCGERLVSWLLAHPEASV